MLWESGAVGELLAGTASNLGAQLPAVCGACREIGHLPTIGGCTSSHDMTSRVGLTHAGQQRSLKLYVSRPLHFVEVRPIRPQRFSCLDVETPFLQNFGSTGVGISRYRMLLANGFVLIMHCLWSDGNNLQRLAIVISREQAMMAVVTSPGDS